MSLALLLLNVNNLWGKVSILRIMRSCSNHWYQDFTATFLRVTVALMCTVVYMNIFVVVKGQTVTLVKNTNII
jgi:hypothetical protein